MPYRTIAPVIQPIDQVSLQEVKEVSLNNGVPLFYLNAGQQPVMRLEIIFNAGKWFETKPGLSYFTGKMLTEGTTSKSAQEISMVFDNLGAFMEVIPGFDRITLTIHLLTKHLATLLPVIAEIISKPAFRDAELRNIKQLKKQQLLVDLEKNSFIAAQKFTENVFGKEHPYGRSLNSDNIDNTTVELVSEFYVKQLEGNFEIVVAGKVTEDDLKRINEVIGQIPKFSRLEPPLLPYKYKPSSLLVEKEESLQSSVRMGMTFINRHHPDFNAILVVNEILGGYFGSRLMRNIREDKGYTYGIHSGISCLKHNSMLVISTEVKKEFRDQTINEIIKEIKILQNELVPNEELDTVKNYMLGTFISETDTPFALADKFKTIHYSGLDYGFYQNYVQTIMKIDNIKIQQLAQEYLVLENLSKVVVG